MVRCNRGIATRARGSGATPNPDTRPEGAFRSIGTWQRIELILTS